MDDVGAPFRLAGRHVLVDAGRATYARLVSARYLVSKGVTVDEADAVQVVAWKPNGWLPPLVVVIGAARAGFTEQFVELPDG